MIHASFSLHNMVILLIWKESIELKPSQTKKKLKATCLPRKLWNLILTILLSKKCWTKLKLFLVKMMKLYLLKFKSTLIFYSTWLFWIQDSSLKILQTLQTQCKNYSKLDLAWEEMHQSKKLKLTLVVSLKKRMIFKTNLMRKVK